MAKNKQWIHKAMKEWDSTDGHDLKQKNRIARIIRNNNLHHFPLFDTTIFINKTDFTWTKVHPEGFNNKEELLRQWQPFMPDIFFPLKKTIIELDGDFHRNTAKGVKQTKLRNQHYEYAELKLIEIDTNELNSWSDEKLYLFLKEKL